MPLLPLLDCYRDSVNSRSIKETMKWNLRVSLSSVIMVIYDSQLSLAFWGVKLYKVALHIVKSICFKLLACAINL